MFEAVTNYYKLGCTGCLPIPFSPTPDLCQLIQFVTAPLKAWTITKATDRTS